MTGEVIHFSDIHVSDARQGKWKRTFRGFRGARDEELERLADAGTISEHRSMQRAVVSGDLTADGHEAQLPRSFAFVIETLRLQNGASKGLDYTDDAVIIPGNHDVWGGGLLRGTARGRKQKTKVLERKEWDLEQGRSKYLAGAPVVVRSPSPTASGLELQVDILTIDSTREGLGNLFATGRVDENGLAAIRRCQHRDQLRMNVGRDVYDLVHITVAVLHHPVRYVNEPQIRLQNGREVFDELQAAGIGLVLCGHEHRNHVGTIGTGGPVQVIAGTAAQESVDCSFVTIDFDADAVANSAASVLLVPATVTVFTRTTDTTTFTGRKQPVQVRAAQYFCP